MQQLYDYAVLAVRTYNQTMTPDENRQKKMRALNYLADKATELGVNISGADLDNLIEGIVNEVKEAAKAGKAANY